MMDYQKMTMMLFWIIEICNWLIGYMKIAIKLIFKLKEIINRIKYKREIYKGIDQENTINHQSLIKIICNRINNSIENVK
jgi:hypothetical protein